VLDLYDDWAALREVSESGCVLVRPDLHVAWRSHDLSGDPTAALGHALDSILGRGDDGDADGVLTPERSLTAA
jgi:2,4-dichlorophenol 6-monooxygenase